jgi:hypothetical protein
MHTEFWLESLKESDHSEDLSDGHRETLWEGVDWTYLAQSMDQWWALVNIVINLQIP